MQPGRAAGRAVMALIVVAALTAAADARAEDKVRFNADVVYASSQGNALDPPSLAPMKTAFAKDFTFTSFKRLATQVIELQAKKPAELSLPNGKSAHFELDRLEKGVAVVKSVVAGVETEIRLGKQKSVYLVAGKHQDGMLILMVSPIPEAAKEASKDAKPAK